MASFPPTLAKLLSARHTPQSRQPRWLALLIVIGLALGWHLSWSVLPTRALWDELDRAVFGVVNDSLRDGVAWQRFWAHANRHVADLVAVALFVVLYSVFLWCSQHSSALHRACKCAFAAAVTTAAVLLSEQIHASVERVSPSLVFDDAVRLGERVTDLKFKYASHECFPGDHGIALICLAFGLWFYAGRWLGMLGALVGIGFVLPRVVVGAHWASDILVGSATFSLVLLGILFLTPIHAWIVDRTCALLEAGLRAAGLGSGASHCPSGSSSLEEGT